MSIRLRKSISIDDLMEFWKDVRDKNWGKIAPDFWTDVTNTWQAEIMKRFTEMKKGGSYGAVTEDTIKFMCRNPNVTFLPRDIDYPPPWKYVMLFGPPYDPHTYVQRGYLRTEMAQRGNYNSVRQTNKIGVRVNIPDHPRNTDGYRDLESYRSFVKSSFVLAWPDIIKNTLNSIIK